MVFSCYCQLCDVTIKHRFDLFPHSKGLTHQKNRSLETVDDKLSRSVLIKDVPFKPSYQELNEVFKFYCDIESFSSRVKTNSVIVKLWNRNDVKKVLQRKDIYYKTQKLSICEYVEPPKCPQPPSISEMSNTALYNIRSASPPYQGSSKFAQHESPHTSKDWKINYPDSFENPRNIDMSKPLSRPRDLFSSRNIEITDLRIMRDSDMPESYMRRLDRGDFPLEKRSDADIRIRSIQNSSSQRDMKDTPTLSDYRYANSHNEYFSPESHKHLNSSYQEPNPFVNPLVTVKRDQVLPESHNRLWTLSKNISVPYSDASQNKHYDDTLFQRKASDRRAAETTEEYRSSHPAEYYSHSKLHLRDSLQSGLSPRDHVNHLSHYRDHDIKTMSELQESRSKLSLSKLGRRERSREREDSGHVDKKRIVHSPRYESPPNFHPKEPGSKLDSRSGSNVKKVEVPVSRKVARHNRTQKCLSNFTATLKLKGDFNEQLSTLMKELRRFEFDPSKVRRILADMKSAFQEYPGCQVLLCGPVVTGLTLPDSTVSFLVKFTSMNLDHIRATLDKKHSSQSKVSQAVLQSLLRLPDVFSSVDSSSVDSSQDLSKGKGIELRHSTTKYIISIVSQVFSVTRSEFLKVLISTDERLPTLFKFLNYWARVNSFISDYNKFTHLSFNWLVVFYLQRISKPILPPAQLLQSNPTYDVFLNGWNSGFNSSLQNIPRNENTSSLLTLIEDFFDFYSNFVFTDFIISPLLGLAIPTSAMKNVEDLPKSFDLYVKNVKLGNPRFKPNPVMNIQDPFELNFNTTHMKMDVRVSFQSSCKRALSHFCKCHKTGNYEGLLNEILNFNQEKAGSGNLSSIITLPVHQNDILSEEKAMLIFVRLNKLLTNIIKNILKCEFTCVKDVKYDTKGALVSPHARYNCKAYFNLWSSRKNLKKNNLTTLDQEVAATNKIINSLYRNQQPGWPILAFTLEACIKMESKFIQFSVKCDDAYTESFADFGEFLSPLLDLSTKKLVSQI